MISKELLSKVLGIDILLDTHEDDFNENSILIYWEFTGKANDCKNINIYELANKCKEWIDVDIKINHYKDNEYRKGSVEVILNYDNTSIFANKSFGAQTEPEAIFLACQWILDNKED